MQDYLVDMRLSYTAIGIYSALLHGTPGRAYSEADILSADKVAEEGEVLAGINELAACGYIERVEGHWVVKGA